MCLESLESHKNQLVFGPFLAGFDSFPKMTILPNYHQCPARITTLDINRKNTADGLACCKRNTSCSNNGYDGGVIQLFEGRETLLGLLELTLDGWMTRDN